MVSGVPGAGKSVVLESWLRDRPDLPRVWMSCDARDVDPVSFWRALSAALTRAWPDRWLDLIDLLAEAAPDLDDVAIAVVNELADLGEPVVLAVDDFHHSAAAAPSVGALIDRLPTGCRVVIGTRGDPGLSLARHRAYGRVLEVRNRDLRLTGEEIAAMMQMFDVELSPDDVEVVERHTEGWMAGVQLTAMALRERPDAGEWLSELVRAPRSIAAFLDVEVLDRLPGELRDFVLATSVLEVMDPDVCEAVTGRPDAKAWLARVEDADLFLTELAPGHYRFHHLFGDLLRHRLRDEDPERERALHRRAAAYRLDEGDLERALGHLFTAGDEVEAFEILRDNLQGAFYQGDGRLPGRLSNLVEGRSTVIDPARLPDLAVAIAASAPAGEADPWIARADRHEAELGETDRARLAVARAIVALRVGDADGIEAAFGAYATPADIPDPELAGNAASLLARSRLWLGEITAARRAFEGSLRSPDGRPWQEVVMASGLAWTACVEGELTEAAQVAARALAAATSMGLVGHPVSAEALCAQGRVAFERGDLAAAEKLLEQAVSVSEEVRPAFALLGQLCLARVWLAAGRVGEAFDGVALARDFLPVDSTSPLLAFHDGLAGRVAIECGDLDLAEAHLERLGPGYRADLLETRIHLARGDWGRAAAALARRVPETVRGRLDGAVLAARVAAGSRAADADERLLEAVDLAKPDRFVVAITDDAAELRPQLTRLLRPRRVGAFEQAVLERLEDGLPVVTTADQSAGPLSGREVTVVRYLASRLTNREIASELYISTNTLKTHVQRVYRKLGVSSRREAVAEARRLGLL